MSTAGCNSPSRQCFTFRPVLNQAYNPGLIVRLLRTVSLIHTLMPLMGIFYFLFLFLTIKVRIANGMLQGGNRNERLEPSHRALRLFSQLQLYKGRFSRRINLLRNFLKKYFRVFLYSRSTLISYPQLQTNRPTTPIFFFSLCHGPYYDGLISYVINTASGLNLLLLYQTRNLLNKQCNKEVNCFIP